MTATPAPGPARGGLGISTRSVVIGLVVGLPLSAFFLILAMRDLDTQSILDALGRAEPVQIAAAVVLMLVVYVLQAERWRRIARHVGTAPRRTFTGLVIGGVAVNNVIPGRPGEMLRGYWLARTVRAPVARSFSTVVVDRGADVVALVALLAVSIPFIDRPTWLLSLTIAGVVVAVLIGAGLLVSWWYAHRSARGKARGVEGAVQRGRIRHHVSGLVRGAASVVNRRDIFWLALLSVAAWFAWTVACWTVAHAVGITLNPVEALFVTCVLNLGAAIPSSPGFVGTYQWLSVASLGLLGVGRNDAFAFSVLMQAVWFVPTTIIGIALGLFATATWRGARRVESPTLEGNAPVEPVSPHPGL